MMTARFRLIGVNEPIGVRRDRPTVPSTIEGHVVCAALEHQADHGFRGANCLAASAKPAAPEAG
jgi:hypothetical protein